MAKYSVGMRAVHWLMSLIIIGVLGMGLYMTGLSDDHPSKWDYYALHKSFGVLVLGLILVRIILRLVSEIPETEKGIGKLYDVMSKVVIFALYVLMFCVPASGYMMSMIGGHGVLFFGMKVPNILPEFIMTKGYLGGVAYNVHIYGAYVFIAAIVLHLLGTIKHVFIDKINILKRIV